MHSWHSFSPAWSSQPWRAPAATARSQGREGRRSPGRFARSSSPGADVNATSGDGSTPLLWAAHGSNIEIARALIAAKAKVDVANDFGVTPLLDASRTGDAPMVDLLLRPAPIRRARIPRARRRCWRPRAPAACRRCALLLARGADVNATEKFQKTTRADVGRGGRPRRRGRICCSRPAPTRTSRAHVTSLTRAPQRRPSDRRLHGADVGRAQRQRGDGAPARRAVAPTSI